MNLLQRTCLAVVLVLSPLAGCGGDDKGKKPAAECGNGKIDTLEDGAMEECDGDELGGATCSSVTMNPSSTGSVTCSANCTFVTTGCSMPSTGGTGGGGSGGMAGGGMGGMAGGGMGGMATGGTEGGVTGGTGGADAAPPADASTDASTEGGPGGPGGPGGGGPP